MEPVRLSKRMAELGLCSRREADEYIAQGWVKVDGVIVDVLGSKVLPDQNITLEKSAQFAQAQRMTVLINKPIGYVHVVRTLDVGVGVLATAGEGGEDVLTGYTTLRFFDLAGKPLALQMGPMGTKMTGLAGPFRAVRASTAD